jgi:hypothetical protein
VRAYLVAGLENWRDFVKTILLAALMFMAAVPAWAQQREEAAEIRVASGTLAGTLLLPASSGKVPVVLVIAGSGPTDRNGNTQGMGPNNSLRLLGEGLAARGIASLRVDKRGVGGSAGALTREADIRFDDLIADAEGWVRKLRADPRFSTVTVLGHSEGSLIGMVAARQAGADAFVSVAGAGRPAGQILRDQLRPRLPPALNAQSDSILAALEAGRTRDSVPPVLAALYRPSAQPYLISWLRRDPAREIAQLRVPVLVAQGTTDIQVGTADAQALHAALPASRLLVVEGMNHVLKEVPADAARQMASYTDPSLPVAQPLVDGVAAFVLRVHRP